VGRVWNRAPGCTASTRSAVGAFSCRAVYALRVLVSPEISTARSCRRKASRWPPAASTVTLTGTPAASAAWDAAATRDSASAVVSGATAVVVLMRILLDVGVKPGGAGDGAAWPTCRSRTVVPRGRPSGSSVLDGDRPLGGDRRCSSGQLPVTALQGGRDHGEHQSTPGEGRAHPVGGGVAEAGRDHRATEPGRECVAEVEGADVDGRGQGGSPLGLVEHPLLQRRDGREAEGADQGDRHGGEDL